MGMHGWYGGFGMGWGWILWLILIGVGIYLLITATRRNPYPPAPRNENPGEDQALSILRERYARGEITDEEFERMKEKLKNK
ncbi:conserved hypothetical protein [[Clostridium] ultunense Esp]|uniref:SHOCT domain-containing protein n=1 Tax=Thermicanus aegyptius TaxID=94009 RepID=UPI0002B6F9B7|nr:SHOCT domain-containing protein [Thermicanus aegyptius]CCQ96289.1 conserved hypothetical protein [[Clostridium] ultunense Esp]